MKGGWDLAVVAAILAVVLLGCFTTASGSYARPPRPSPAYCSSRQAAPEPHRCHGGPKRFGVAPL